MEEHCFEHKTVKVNGVNMHVVEKGQGPIVLFIHGFPEFWYSWRHQISFTAKHGYRAVGPDLRGYGDTTGIQREPIETLKAVYGDDYYVVRFQEPGEIEAEFAKISTKKVLEKFLSYRNPGPLYMPKGKPFDDSPVILPSWLSSSEVDYFASTYEKTGFTGGVNYYRALDRVSLIPTYRANVKKGTSDDDFIGLWIKSFA
ncbi:hypothetical protein K7X08_022308 [Anisodus acutangulus]|uniref:AB hydrolase-1 domain-containing protein n=1 Tax=Anisodus acutangulus TaxID=402998 RepID=A0A9Q1MKV8_9SOLA|nr:hypothetical protein K7X08_022308 [Anisodus acutangulus]